MAKNSWLWIGLGIAALVLLGGGGLAVYSMVRGIRNNNPGNIRADGTAWEGLATPNSDGTFFIFKDATYGIRAIARILSNYVSNDGVASTVTGLISRWAPPSENDTASYINDVANQIGVGPDDVIDVNAYMPGLVAAIVDHENGVQPYAAATIQNGIALA